MVTRVRGKQTVTGRTPGSAADQPTAVVDPFTLALTAKGVYEAAKAGVDLSVKLYEVTKGDVALVCAVYESATIENRFRLRLRVSSVCPHGIVVNKITLATPKDVPLDMFLLRQSSRGFGWDARSQPEILKPEIAGRSAIRVDSPFVIPPLRTQEIVIEVERAPVLARIFNKRGAALSIDYNVLGHDGDAKHLPVKVLFRDDQPLSAGFFTPDS
jgi:hypothetical protein